MKNFYFLSNKHFRFMAVLCLLFTLCVGNAWGADPYTESTMSDIATRDSWTTASGNGTQTCYTSFGLDAASNAIITVSTAGSANCGSFWGSDWRLYQAQKGDVTITAKSGYTLKSVTFTFSVKNNGQLKDGSTVLTSASAYTISGTSKTFTVGASSGTSGQIRITKIKVVYASTGSTKTLV